MTKKKRKKRKEEKNNVPFKEFRCENQKKNITKKVEGLTEI